MPNDWSSIESTLKTQLEKYDLELQSVSKKEGDKTLELDALKLTPVSVHNNKPLYIPVPVTVEVTLDENNTIRSVKGDQIDPETNQAASKFYQGLADRNEISGLAGGDPALTATHELSLNEKGQQIVRRKRFQ